MNLAALLLTSLIWLRRLVLVAAWSAALLVLLALAGLWWLTSTPAGTQWGIQQAERLLPPLSVEQVAGTPWQGLTLDGVIWSPQEGARLRMDTTRLRIDPAELWRGRLHLFELSLRGGEVELPLGEAMAPNADDAPWRLPSLPAVAVDVDQLAIDQLVILRDGQRYQLLRGRLEGHLETRGERPRLAVALGELDLRLPDDLRLEAAGDLMLEPTGAMPLVAQLELLIDHPRGWLSGQITADGSLQDSVTLVPQLAWIGVDGVPATACGRLELALGASQLHLDTLRVAVLGGLLDLQGEARWAPDWSVALTGRAESIDPAWIDAAMPGNLGFMFDAQLDAMEGWLPAAGQVKISALNGQLAGEPVEDVALDLRLDQTQATARLSGMVAGGQLHLDGELASDLAFTADWQIEALPLPGGEDESAAQLASSGHLDGQLPESLALLDGHGPLTAAGWIERSRVVLEAGELRLTEGGEPDAGRSAELQLAVRLEQGRLSVQRATLTAPGADLSISGGLTLSPDWARWRLDGVEAQLSAPDLAALPWDLLARVPGLDLAALQPQTARGSVELDLSVTGPLLAPHGELDLRGERLRLAGYQLDRLVTNARVDAGDDESSPIEDRPVQLSLQADRLRSTRDDDEELLFEQLTVLVDGRRADHHWTLDLRGSTDAHLEARGGWQENVWQGRMTQLTLDSPRAGGWRLLAPAQLSLSPALQRVDGLCLAPVAAAIDRPGSLCLDGERQTSGLEAQLRADLALEAIWKTIWRQWPELAGDEMEWPGRLKMDGQLALAEGDRTADLSLVLPASELRVVAQDEDDETAAEVVAYPETRLSLRLVDEEINASLKGGLEDWLMFAGQGRASLEDRSIAGDLSLSRVDLGRLFPLLERLGGPMNMPVSDVVGTVGGRLTLAGRLDAPSVSGRLTGQGLGFASLAAGTEYRDGRLEITLSPDGDLQLSGSLLGEADTPPKPVFDGRHVTETAMPASRGRLELEGTGRVKSLDDWQVSARLGGEAVPLLRLPTLALDARPDLVGEFRPSGGQLSGQIHVPLAIVNIARLPSGVRSNSEDLVIVGEKREPRSVIYPVTGDIEVVLGEDVSLRGLGLATRLTGGIDLRIRPDQPVGGFGEIRLVDGRYDAYGQLLTVERGRLIFSGALTSPGLDVVATRQIDDADGTVVGLQVIGPLDSPETEVFSRPATSPSDALSLLLTGRRLSTGGDADASLLLNAIAGLGIRQGDEMAQQVKSVFGVDEIGFTSADGVEGTRLSVGKRIGDNLLVRYAVGVFDGVGEVITSYRLNRFLRLELSSSAESQSGDLIYQIETGRPED
ncbi:MAG: translocation/assembly module TamB domain-containing protein [Halothiobacillaceae bacterium]